MILSSHVAVLARNMYVTDEAFSAELAEVYGKDARENRYLTAKNRATPRLRMLADEFRDAVDRWTEAFELLRKQQAR